MDLSISLTNRFFGGERSTIGDDLNARRVKNNGDFVFRHFYDSLSTISPANTLRRQDEGFP